MGHCDNCGLPALRLVERASNYPTDHPAHYWSVWVCGTCEPQFKPIRKLPRWMNNRGKDLTGAVR